MMGVSVVYMERADGIHKLHDRASVKYRNANMEMLRTCPRYTMFCRNGWINIYSSNTAGPIRSAVLLPVFSGKLFFSKLTKFDPTSVQFIFQ